MADAFNMVIQQRVMCANANEWVPVVITPGCRHPLIVLEDDTVSYRVSLDNTILPDSQGIPMEAGSSYYFDGVNSVEFIVYVSVEKDNTCVILQFTKE